MASPDNTIQDARRALQSGNLKIALSLFKKAVKLNPTDIDTWHMLAVVNGMLGNYVNAENCCRKVLRLQPRAHQALNNLGSIQKNLGKLNDAEASYRKAIKIKPDYAEAANNLATLLLDQDKKEEALEYYRTAVKLEPIYAEAHNNLGVLLQARGSLSEALAHYQKAVQLQPDNPESIYNLGCGLLETGKYKEAALAFQRVVMAQPRNSRAWTSLGAAQVRLKQHKSVKDSCQKAISLDPNNWEAYFHLGNSYQNQHLDVEAERMYRKALEIKPELESAKYFLSILGADETPAQSPAEYVKDLFDGYAETFDNQLVTDLQYKTPSHLFNIVSRHTDIPSGGLKIIDLGCGTGLCGPLFRDMASYLVGVDLSPKMIEKARARNLYDDLFVDDLISPLEKSETTYDIAIAADVFVYVGDLDKVFSAVFRSLEPGGIFAFSTEFHEGQEDFVLRPTGRYAHTANYTENLAQTYGFMIVNVENLVLRKEAGSDIQGNIHVLKKPLPGNNSTS